MNIDDMEQNLLADYGRLHDGLSDMVEGGRLRKGDIPEDYQWLVEKLADLASQEAELTKAIATDTPSVYKS